MKCLIVCSVFAVASHVAVAFIPNDGYKAPLFALQAATTTSNDNGGADDRRAFLSTVAVATGALVTGALTTAPQPAQAVGPVKLTLKPTKYIAAPCPPSKPIPGEKAMFGMRGLCVTVQADVLDVSPKDLEKVGVYGFVIDGETGNSVLANNPDLR